MLFQFHNLPHLIIFLRLIFIYFKKRNNVTNNKENIMVKNVLGKNISTAVNADTYFKDLKQMWK